jgi:ATP-dependent DNA helicase RecG
MSSKQLILSGESQTLEFKTSFDKSTIESLTPEAFYLTNNIEKYGSGFIRIRKALQEYPETSFEVQEIGGGVLVTFAQAGAKQLQEAGATELKSSEKSSEKSLALLRKSPALTISDLAQQLGISQRAVEKQIENLKRNGTLRRVGPDKGGHWQVLEKS